jgi:hypothetical protein
MLQKVYLSGKSEQNINDVIDAITAGQIFKVEPALTTSRLPPPTMFATR